MSSTPSDGSGAAAGLPDTLASTSTSSQPPVLPPELPLSHVPSTSAFAPLPPRPALAPSSSLPDQWTYHQIAEMLEGQPDLKSYVEKEEALPCAPHQADHPEISIPPILVPPQHTYKSLLDALTSDSQQVENAPSYSLKISDPKPSMTVPPLRPTAVAARRIAGGKTAAPATVATAEAARDQWLPSSSGASTSSASKSARVSRKRVAPLPQEEKSTVEDNFILTTNLDWSRTHVRLVPEKVVQDDDIQVIEERIVTSHKDHSKNPLYDVTIRELQQDMKKGDGQNEGILMSSHQAAVLRLRYIADHTVRCLQEYGWAVVDKFLGDNHVWQCKQEIDDLYEKRAMGAQSSRVKEEVTNVSSDSIFWYDGADEPATATRTIHLLVSMLDAMIHDIQSRFDGETIKGRSGAMLVRHPVNTKGNSQDVDNPNENGRLITCVYYGNLHWQETHGGQLVLFPQTCNGGQMVHPQADRLVIFWSTTKHRVMKVIGVPQYSVTVWYMDETELQAAFEHKSKLVQATGLVQAGVRAEHLADPEKMRELILQHPNIGKLLQFGSTRQTHSSASQASNDAAAAAAPSESAPDLAPQAAAVGGHASDTNPTEEIVRPEESN